MRLSISRQWWTPWTMFRRRRRASQPTPAIFPLPTMVEISQPMLPLASLLLTQEAMRAMMVPDRPGNLLEMGQVPEMLERMQ